MEFVLFELDFAYEVSPACIVCDVAFHVSSLQASTDEITCLCMCFSIMVLIRLNTNAWLFTLLMYMVDVLSIVLSTVSWNVSSFIRADGISCADSSPI